MAAAPPQPVGLVEHTRPMQYLPASVAAHQSHNAATAEDPARHTREPPPQPAKGSAASLPTSPMAPPAPPPAHLTHSSLPPPHPPRSLHEPWRPYCSLDWYNSQSPSIRSGLSPQDIAASHWSAYIFVATLSLTMRYPFSVLECGMSFYHRFYARCSTAEYDVKRVAAVCLFLASKVEDAPRRLIELVRYFEAVVQQGDEHATIINATINAELTRQRDELPSSGHDESIDRQPQKVASPAAPPTEPASPPSPASHSPFVSHVAVEQYQQERDRPTQSEHELRTQFIALESEVLLVIDFDFTVPLPSLYIRLLVRQLVLSPPRTDTGKGREGWEDEIRELAWERAMVRGGEAIVMTAMRHLLVVLSTSAYLHFSPQSIAVMCVLIACLASKTDIERMLQLGGWVSVATTGAAQAAEQQFPAVSAELKEEATNVHFSPSSFTSTTPSFSPQYAVSPTSPTTASPASLSSIQSSPSQPPPLQPVPVVVSTKPASVPSSSPVVAPYTAAWIQRALPGVSVDELLSLISVLMLRQPLSDQPARATETLRLILLGLDNPAQTPQDADMLDVLHVRSEHEATVSELVEAKRLRDLLAAQKEAGEEKQRREEEAASRQKREHEIEQRRVRESEEELKRPGSQERMSWAPHSPSHSNRPANRGRGGWLAGKPSNERPAYAVGRGGGSWRGAGHRGGWTDRQPPPPQQLPPPVGWQSTVIEPPTAPATHSLSRSQSNSHRRTASPTRHRSPSPPPKRSRRSPSRSPPRTSSGRDRDRDRDRYGDRTRARDGRALRENGDRSRRGRSRSPSVDSPNERHRASSRSKRCASPSTVRDRGRGRR